MAKIIDGKAVAAQIRDELKQRVLKIKEKGRGVKLSVILVGDDPASHVYVRNKERGCADVGIQSETIRLPQNAEEGAIVEAIKGLNNDKAVDGFLVQLPLPKEINEKRVLSYIDPRKDVDGLHVENMGKLIKGEKPYFLPCTPQGIIQLILSTGEEIKGKEAVVVGRSNIVGKPVSILLLNQNATVTICHSKTENLEKVIARGDIVVAAIGKPRAISGEAIKPGAIVIDVGVNRTEKGLVGDVDFEKAKEKAAYITPVPGGVGPMTIAMLLKNTVIAAERSLEGR